MKESKVVLIHATPLAMAPVAAAFERLWPQAECRNLLDDGLAPDLAGAGSLTPQLVRRIVDLAEYGKAQGARGILFTCSAFGPAIDEAARVVGVPTLKPNEAMFDEALAICAPRGGACRIGLLTTFAPAAQPMLAQLQAMARQRGQAVALETACAAGALEALNGGDPATHDRLIAEQARALAGCDVLMLGQFSMARVQARVAQETGQTVLTSPDSAVRRLKAALSGSH